ncbi:MAG: hypothetical protein AAFV71_29990 [Cyanobacteria bacterium J06633_8]
MQQIIDLKAKLESGKSKKYSLLRIAIASYLGDEFTFNYNIRTSEGKQKLLYLANRLIEEEEVPRGRTIVRLPKIMKLLKLSTRKQ